MTLERHKQAAPRKSRGAVRCFASPAGGWSYVQVEAARFVTVIDVRAGGYPVTRAVPLRQVEARMSPAEVRKALKAGHLVETNDGTGFHLLPSP